jgi:hypothetical protein
MKMVMKYYESWPNSRNLRVDMFCRAAEWHELTFLAEPQEVLHYFLLVHHGG